MIVNCEFEQSITFTSSRTVLYSGQLKKRKHEDSDQFVKLHRLNIIFAELS